MKVSDSLTWLAETVLEEALKVAWRDMAERHGVPCYVVDGVVLATAPFADRILWRGQPVVVQDADQAGDREGNPRITLVERPS